MAFTPEQIEEFKRRYNEDYPQVDERLMQAVFKKESAGNDFAESDKKAFGPGQIMPETWYNPKTKTGLSKELGLENVSFDELKTAPDLNRLASKHLLNQLLTKYKVPHLALAGYNWNPQHLDNYLEQNPNLRDVDYLTFANSLVAPERKSPNKETSEYIKDIWKDYSGEDYYKNLIENYKRKMSQENSARFLTPDSTSDNSSNLYSDPDIEKWKSKIKLWQDSKGKGADNGEANYYKQLIDSRQRENNRVFGNGSEVKINPDFSKKYLGLPLPNIPQDPSKVPLKEGDFLLSPLLADPNNPRSGGVVANSEYLMPEIPSSDSLASDEDIKFDDKEPSAEKKKILSLLEALQQAQAQQSKDAGLMAMLKAGGDIADAFAAGRGGNTTKLGNSAMEFAEKRLGEDEKNLKEQVAMRKAELDLRNIEEANDPNSQLSQMQTGFLKKMAQDLDLDVSSINAMGAKNATELMQSLAYLSKSKAEMDLKKQAAIERIKKEMKVSDKQAKDIADFDVTLANVDQIMDLLGRNSNFTGSFDGRVPDMLVGADQVAWRTAIGLLNDQYRRLITGQAAGDKELRLLQSRLPQATDTYNDFIAKAQMFRQAVANARNTQLANFQRAGKDVSEYGIPAASIDKGFTVKDDIAHQKQATAQDASGQPQISRQKQPNGKIALFDVKTRKFLGYE